MNDKNGLSRNLKERCLLWTPERAAAVCGIDAQVIRDLARLMGETARHYPGNDTLEIDQARMRSVAPNGRLTVARADRALSNGDGSEVQLFGNAVVTREPTPAGGSASAQPRLEFRGEFLHAFTQEEKVRSNRPVQLTRGNDRFTADTMEYDNLDQVLQLSGRVRGVLMPTPAK